MVEILAKVNHPPPKFLLKILLKHVDKHQPYLQWLRHSFTTRLLYTLIPATWYAKDDASIDSLHQCLAEDLEELFSEGLPVKAQKKKLFFQHFLGIIMITWIMIIDLNKKMFWTILEVAGSDLRFFVAVVGAKGDWPWVRKAFHLSSGYRSKRVCHLCPSNVP